MASDEQQQPRRSTTPKKKSWYELVPEYVELSPPSRSHSSSSSRRSSGTSRSASPALSKSQEYTSPSQVPALEEFPLGEETLEESKVTTQKESMVKRKSPPSGSHSSSSSKRSSRSSDSISPALSKSQEYSLPSQVPALEELPLGEETLEESKVTSQKESMVKEKSPASGGLSSSSSSKRSSRSSHSVSPALSESQEHLSQSQVPALEEFPLGEETLEESKVTMQKESIVKQTCPASGSRSSSSSKRSSRSSHSVAPALSKSQEYSSPSQLPALEEFPLGEETLEESKVTMQKESMVKQKSATSGSLSSSNSKRSSRSSDSVLPSLSKSQDYSLPSQVPALEEFPLGEETHEESKITTEKKSLGRRSPGSLPGLSKNNGDLEYSSHSQVSTLEEFPLEDETHDESKAICDKSKVSAEQISLGTRRSPATSESSVLSKSQGVLEYSSPTYVSSLEELPLGEETQAEGKVTTLQQKPFIKETMDLEKGVSAENRLVTDDSQFNNLSRMRESSLPKGGQTKNVKEVSSSTKGPVIASDQIQHVDEGVKVLGSRSEEILPPGKSSSSHASFYSLDSQSTVSAGLSREYIPLEEGTISSGSGSSMEIPMATPHGSASRMEDSDERNLVDSKKVEDMSITQAVGSADSVTIRKETSVTPVDKEFQGPAVALTQYPLDQLNTREGNQTHLEAGLQEKVLEQKLVEEETSSSSHTSFEEQKRLIEEAREKHSGHKHYEGQSGIHPHTSAQLVEPPQSKFESAKDDGTGSLLLEGNMPSVTSTMGNHDDEHSCESSSYQDPQSSLSSASSQSVPDDVGIRGSQVQLPLDLNSLQPLTQTQVVPSHSGVVLSHSGELIGKQDQSSIQSDGSLDQSLAQEITAQSGSKTSPPGDGRRRQAQDSSISPQSRFQGDQFLSKSGGEDHSSVSESAKVIPQSHSGHYPAKYPTDTQSQPSSGSRRPDYFDTSTVSQSDSQLVRPSDLYGSPKDQSLEDTLARKVLQLLIERGQIPSVPKDKADRARSKSSSCSGSPDSIDGSLTPSSQKDFPHGQDVRRDSLNRQQLSGRQSPASSVASSTETLALHIQQLLKESEHLRARAPGRDAGSGGGFQQNDAADMSDVSTSSSVRRIIRRVNRTDVDVYEDPRQGSERSWTGDSLGRREGRVSTIGLRTHSAELRGSGHSSPRSQGGESPYRLDSGRASPRYVASDSHQSPSHVRSTSGIVPLPHQDQEDTHLSVDGDITGSPIRKSLSQRVQTILAGTTEDPPQRSRADTDMYHTSPRLSDRYQGQDYAEPLDRGSYVAQGSIPLRRVHSVRTGRGSQDVYQDASSGYYTQEVNSSRRVQSDGARESVVQRVQAILMEEDAVKERVDRVLMEAGVFLPIDQKQHDFQPAPQTESDAGVASFHTVVSGVPSEDQQQPIMGSFAALERARANLEQQLQAVSERNFDHSITWETPVKRRQAHSDQSFERSGPGMPREAWKESRIPVRGQEYFTANDAEPISDPQNYGASTRSDSSIKVAGDEFYSLPPSMSPSASNLRSSHDASGARPRSYPQADPTRTPSYGRSQSIPGSAIPRRSFQSTSSSVSRTSHGGTTSLGRSSDFTSQLRTSGGQYQDDQQDVYQSAPYQLANEHVQESRYPSYRSAFVGDVRSSDQTPRPKSATLPRSSDHSRRSTLGSEGYATTESILGSTARLSRGTSPEGSILRPYRPTGTTETLYTYHVDGGMDRHSSTMHSSTTMESTHVGSDDAQPPHFPAHALGSRKDPPRRDGSMIPRMSPRRFGRDMGEVKGHSYSGTGLPARREDLEQEHPSTVDPEVTGGARPEDVPLDLSRSRLHGPDDGSQPLTRSLGRASPSHTRYRQEQDIPGTLDRDVHYAKLPPQTSQATYVEGQRSMAAPGVYSRQVLTDVLQDENASLDQADEMWRQYQQLRERQLDDTEGTSFDDTKVQRLASLIHDPVGHTARNIIQESEAREQGHRTVDGTTMSEASAVPATRDGITAGIQTVDTRANVVATQTSFTSLEGGDRVERPREGQSPKRQKTSRITSSGLPHSGIPRPDSKPPSGIPGTDPKITERAVAKAVTPTKRKAVSQEAQESVSDANVESMLSDLSLDSEQLLLLLGSHGVKKLSSKLLHLQQRIEKQKEHHRKQTAAGPKSRKPKHAAGKKKTLPRPTRASTPAPEPESELIKEVVDIVQGQEMASTTSPSAVSSVTTQETSDLGIESSESTLGTSESNLAGPVKPHKEGKEGLMHGDESRIAIKRGKVNGHAKDDSEVEYRTSESDVSVLCSCRPTLRRPKSATESSRRREANQGQMLNDGFKVPVGAAPRVASRIPVKDKNGKPRIPAEESVRNQETPSRHQPDPKRFPKGTAFTIDLSEDATGEEDKDRETPVEKGVLTDVPEKAQGKKSGVLVERRGTTVANRANGSSRNQTPHGVAWFQPFSKRMPWQEERPRPKPIIIAALQHDPTTGKVSLQDAFLKHRPDFISQCRERQRKMKLAAEERHVQACLEIERQRLFEEQRAIKANPLAHPYSTQLHKPAKRNLTKKEMKKQTSKVYSRLPEVVRKQEENKKLVINETNRLRAQIYRKKLKDRVRAGWPTQ